MSTVKQNDSTWKSPVVLLVENDAVAALVAKNMLETIGCDVCSVKTGEQAIDEFKRRPYDLIIMDVGLPTVDGLVTTKQMRLYEMAISSRYQVPIVGLSGIRDPMIKAKCFEAGMNNMVLKPLTQEAAQDIIQKFVYDAKESDLTINDLTAVTGKIIDINVLVDLIEKSKDHRKIRMMVHEAIQFFPKRCEELKLAYSKDDWKQIHDIALHLSGESAYYGMERLNLACTQLMENLNSRQHLYIESMFENLLKEIQMASEEYVYLKEKQLI